MATSKHTRILLCTVPEAIPAAHPAVISTRWVKDGKLLLRQTETYGPNFPGHAPGPKSQQCRGVTLKAGDKLNLEHNDGGAGKVCQDLHKGKGGRLEMVVSHELCVSASGNALVLAKCGSPGGAVPAAQQFSVPAVDGKPQQVKNSKLCVTGSASGALGLAACKAEQSLEPEASEQLWVLGASGRLCSPSGCLSVVPGKASAAPAGFELRRRFL